MHDVARLAGVSHQTVSRVLNNSASVRPETRARVLEAMRHLNYRPNALARALVSRRSRTIGVISFDTRLHGPASTLLAIERAGRSVGYAVTPYSLPRLDAAAVRAAVNQLTDQSVDGIIAITPNEAAASAVQGLAAHIPIVAVEAGHAGDIPVVSVDQLYGATLATEYLLTLGHSTVWHVAGPADWIEARQRIDGWQASLSKAGLAAPPLLRGDWSAESGYQAGLRLADRHDVSAVFVANDQMALGLLFALRERGINVPSDVSVVGFDDIPESVFFTPPLTTVKQDFEELGRRGLQLLVDLMDGQRPETPARIEPTLVERASACAISQRAG